MAFCFWLFQPMSIMFSIGKAVIFLAEELQEINACRAMHELFCLPRELPLMSSIVMACLNSPGFMDFLGRQSPRMPN